MEHLSLSEIQGHAASVKLAFDALWDTRTLICKPNSKQWGFFKAVFQRLMASGITPGFENISASQAAQWKFEIEDKLRRFYLRSGKIADFTFTLVHKSELVNNAIETADAYPDLAGYCLLVRNIFSESLNPDHEDNLPLLLERVVAESVDAEFRAYMALPEIHTEELQQWFISDSPAMNEIVNLLHRHRKKGWIISNPFNPSTKRLLSVKIKHVRNKEARVNTIEYWYLKWWDQKSDAFVYPYRETNRQMYILRKDEDAWKVYENLRPLPRTSRMLRRNRREGTQRP